MTNSIDIVDHLAPLIGFQVTSMIVTVNAHSELYVEIYAIQNCVPLMDVLWWHVVLKYFSILY